MLRRTGGILALPECVCKGSEMGNLNQYTVSIYIWKGRKKKMNASYVTTSSALLFT